MLLNEPGWWVEPSNAQLWSAVGARVGESSRLERMEAGRSVEGRPIYAVRFGHGPMRVLLWSQMHGDEPTATMAIADIFTFLAASSDPLVERLDSRLTVVFVPMLNPDGAERFQRRNVMGIDINRDARELVTPEGQDAEVGAGRHSGGSSGSTCTTRTCGPGWAEAAVWRPSRCWRRRTTKSVP